MNTDPQLFSELGYVVLPRVFAADEMSRMRAAALEHASHVGDILSHPELAPIVYDDRILSALRSLGIWPARYFGDSNVSFLTGPYGFHRDNTDRGDPNAPDWQAAEYPIVRIAIYLQDYSSHGGGLEVLPQSHQQCDGPFAPAVYLNSGLGDLVIWNLRTFHSGFGGRHLPPQPLPRVALFLAYGLPGAATNRYLAFLKTRTYQFEIWSNSLYRRSTVLEAERRGLLVRDLRADLEGVPGLGRHAGYVPLPYDPPA